MEFKNYYEILGVARDAGRDEIKKAYRKLARKYHPDVSDEADAEDRFKEIGEAYEVLKDPEKRAAYDELGNSWKTGQDFRPPPDWDADQYGFGGGGHYTGMGGADFSDFFSSLFGGGMRGGRGGFEDAFGGRGEDVEAKVTIDLADSYGGATRRLAMQVPELGPDGRIIRRTKNLSVRIPKGIRQGQRIRLAGQGGQGPGGEAGDLYLEVEFAPDRRYRVEGADVYLDLPVAPWEAALGARVTLSTPGGTVDLKIPEDSRPGRKLRLKGRGIPAREPGDFYVVLQVAWPPADSPGARKAYAELKKELEKGFDPRSDLGR